MRLSNKVAVITGSGRGIGRAVALKFAEAGAAVVLNGHADSDAVHRVAREIEAANGQSLAIMADVGSAPDVERLFDETMEAFGRVDILVNNAGITHPTDSILDLDLAYLDSVVNTNFKGVYLCSRRAGKEMVASGGGCIIQISSIAGVVSLPLVVYGPMKSAVNMLTRILAREWAEHKVRVNAIAPGYVLTELVKDLIAQEKRDPGLLLDRVPMHTFIQPEDIAEIALFLASDEARHMTGDIVTVDAGWSADGGWSAYPVR